MGISFNITRNTDTVITPTNYQKANAVKQSDVFKKSINAAALTSDTKADDAENERLLRKMNMAQTRLDTLGEYLGAMQNAQKESGSNVLAMYRRVNHLIGTENDYLKSTDYKNKKNTDTFISDQVAAMNEKLEEIKALRKAQAEKENLQTNDQGTTRTAEDDFAITEEVSTKTTDTKTDTKTISSNYNADEQLKAAQTYRKFDPAYQLGQLMNGFM